MYHLHRLFTAAFGHSIKTYVRKRRLTEAAKLLRTTKRGVLDVALACQFESQASFTRAFRALFGQPPAQFRREGPAVWYGGMERATSASLRHLKHGVTHEPRFETLASPLHVRGLRHELDLENEAELVSLWVELAASITEDVEVYGVGLPAPDARYVYLAGLVATQPWPFAPPPQQTVEVPPGRYAVFTHTGALELLGATVDFIWATWLPRSGFIKSSRPDLERFSLRQLANGAAEMQLWVSVDSR